MDYLQFRSNALQSLALARSQKNYRKNPAIPNHWSSDDVENWIKTEYEKHYGKVESDKK